MNSVEQALSDEMGYLSQKMAFWSAHGTFFAPLVEAVGEDGDCRASTTSLDISIAGSTGLLLGWVEKLEDLGYTEHSPIPDETLKSWYSFFRAEGLPAVWLSWRSLTTLSMRMSPLT